MKYMDSTIKLDEFISRCIPNGKIVFATLNSGVGDYSLIGKIIGSKKKRFLWWEWDSTKHELICEVIAPNTVRYISTDQLDLIIEILSDFENKSGREIRLIKRTSWQQFE